ncbi:hypothetical protein PT2222_290079 [Paraburkholderia tropica]
MPFVCVPMCAKTPRSKGSMRVERRIEVRELTVLLGLHEFVIHLGAGLLMHRFTIRRYPAAGLRDGRGARRGDLRGGRRLRLRLRRGGIGGLREGGRGDDGTGERSNDHERFHGTILQRTYSIGR